MQHLKMNNLRYTVSFTNQFKRDYKKIKDDQLILSLTRTGTHNDLFSK